MSQTHEIETLELRNGELRFTALGCGQGPLVLCLHGFPDHAVTLTGTLQALAAAGYRAVAPNMRGYETSSQPADGDYSLPTMLGDVLGWADQLGADTFDLVGHDWGALLGYVVAERAPDRLRSFTSIAIPHFAPLLSALRTAPNQALLSWYTQFFQLPAIPEWTLRRNDFAFLDWIWRKWSPSYRLPADAVRSLHETFARDGVVPAMLGYYRANITPATFVRMSSSALSTLGIVAVPTLAITGTEDGCIDTRTFDICMRPDLFPGGVEVLRIEGAGHWAHLEEPERVHAAIISWMKEHPHVRTSERVRTP